MLMRGMLRRFPLVMLGLALWFAAEPLLHRHPLQARSSSGSTICAVCATGADRPISAPSVAAPVLVIAIVADAPHAVVRVAATLQLPSRAPPAA
jgi:hypothetical protein